MDTKHFQAKNRRDKEEVLPLNSGLSTPWLKCSNQEAAGKIQRLMQKMPEHYGLLDPLTWKALLCGKTMKGIRLQEHVLWSITWRHCSCNTTHCLSSKKEMIPTSVSTLDYGELISFKLCNDLIKPTLMASRAINT